MKDLNSTKALVKFVLENFEKARNNDNYLYLVVCKIIARRYDCDLDRLPVSVFFLDLSASPFPPFESVRRSRQKIQAECPWLASCEKVSKIRAENEEVFREFARS